MGIHTFLIARSATPHAASHLSTRTSTALFYLPTSFSGPPASCSFSIPSAYLFVSVSSTSVSVSFVRLFVSSNHVSPCPPCLLVHLVSYASLTSLQNRLPFSPISPAQLSHLTARRSRWLSACSPSLSVPSPTAGLPIRYPHTNNQFANEPEGL